MNEEDLWRNYEYAEAEKSRTFQDIAVILKGQGSLGERMKRVQNLSSLMDARIETANHAWRAWKSEIDKICR